MIFLQPMTLAASWTTTEPTPLSGSQQRRLNSEPPCSPSSAADNERVLLLQLHLGEDTSVGGQTGDTEDTDGNVWGLSGNEAKTGELMSADGSADTYTCLMESGPESESTLYSDHVPLPMTTSPSFHFWDLETTTSPMIVELTGAPCLLGVV